MGEPIGVWEQIVNQGPLFAFMALVIWAAVKHIRKTLDDADEREKARETRYNQLIDKTLETASKQTTAVTEALVGNTEVLRRVEQKLNDMPHKATG